MGTRSESGPRRSGRERKQVESIYDEQAEEEQKRARNIDSASKTRGASKTWGG